MVAVHRSNHPCDDLDLAGLQGPVRCHQTWSTVRLLALLAHPWPRQPGYPRRAHRRQADPVPAVYKFDILAATGTSIFASAIISAFILGVGVKMFFETFVETLRELMKPIFTIGLVLGFAFIANYSGISSTLGLAFAASEAVPLLLAVPRLAWGVPDRLGYVEQRAVRQSAGGDRATNRRQSDPLRLAPTPPAGHRQDDLAAVDRRRLRRSRTGRQGIGIRSASP